MQPVRTFIVEDSPVIRDSLIAALEELADVQVIGSAPDEASAVSWLGQASGRYDLVIIDIFLKAGSGLGVLRAAAHARLAAKFVVLTNYATPDIRRRCEQLGADRVFDKSRELDSLIDYCGRLADGVATGPGALG